MCITNSDSITVPNKLYKYYGNINYLISALQHHGVYMDNPVNFNDPFDELYSPIYIGNIKGEKYVVFQEVFDGLLKNQKFIDKYINNNGYDGFEELKNDIFSKDCILLKDTDWVITIQEAADILTKISGYDIDIINEVVTDLISKRKKVKNNYLDETRRISCFCETKESIPMWAYYAKNCTGFCVEYDTSLLDDKTKECIQPVLYSIKRDSNNVSFHKSSQWLHEKEWRIIKSKDDDNIIEDFFKFDCVSAIYFGANYDLSNDPNCHPIWCYPETFREKKYDKYYDLISEIKKQSNKITLYKADINISKFQFDFHEFYCNK